MKDIITVFFFFFLMTWTIFEVSIEFVATLLLFHVLVFWPWGMWDLSSPTRDWTCTHWKVKFQPLYNQGSPYYHSFYCLAYMVSNMWTLRTIQWWTDFFMLYCLSTLMKSSSFLDILLLDTWSNHLVACWTLTSYWFRLKLLRDIRLMFFSNH